MACLDTTTIIDLSGRAGKELFKRANGCIRDLLDGGEVLCMTRLNVAELWVGVYRSGEPTVEQKRVESIIDSLIILELDAGAAQMFGRVSAALLQRGRPIGEIDTLIAAIALDAGEPVVTRNRKHFDEIPGLRVISY